MSLDAKTLRAISGRLRRTATQKRAQRDATRDYDMVTDLNPVIKFADDLADTLLHEAQAIEKAAK